MHTLKMYFVLLKAQLKGQMSYRQSFLIEILGNLIVNIVDLAAIYFLFLTFNQIEGWGLWEVVFFYGLSSTALALAEIISEGFEFIPEKIRTGQLDQMLIRPLSPILQILPTSFRLSKLGRLSQGLFSYFLAFYYLELSFSWGMLFYFFLGLGCSVIIYIGLFMMNAAACFFTVESTEAFNSFTYGGQEMTKFPINIYKPWLRFVFLFIVPLGMVAYFPSLKVLDRVDPLNFPEYFHYFPPFVCMAFLLVSYSFWRWGLSHYQSTGS